MRNQSSLTQPPKANLRAGDAVPVDFCVAKLQKSWIRWKISLINYVADIHNWLSHFSEVLPQWDGLVKWTYYTTDLLFTQNVQIQKYYTFRIAR